MRFMDKHLMKKQIFKIYKKAYKSLEKITPLYFDCGQLCSNKCCKQGSEGMYLFPYESEYLYGKTNSQIIHTNNGFDLLLCKGECERSTRPLACRIFPMFPYLDEKGNLEVKFDLRAKSICPLQYTDIPEITIEKKFTRHIKRVFKSLTKYSLFYDYCRKLTDEINFLKKFY